MLVRTNPILVLAPMLLAGAAACGGGAAATKTAAPPALVDYLPDDAPAVVHVDVARLKASKHYPNLKALFEEAGGVKESTPDEFSRVFAKTQEVALSVSPPEREGGEESSVLVIRGSFAPGDERLVADMMRGEGGTVLPWGEGDVHGWQVGETHVFSPAPGLVVAEERKLHGALLASQKPDGKLPLAAVRPEGFGGAVVTFAADLARLGMSGDQAAAQGAPMAVQRALEAKAASGQVDLVDGLDVRVRLRMADGASAAAVATELADTLRSLGANPMLAILGVGTLVAAAKVSAADADVLATLRLDQGTFENWVNQVENIVKSAIAGFAESLGAAALDAGGESAP